MRGLFSIGARFAILTSLVIAAMAIPARSDTLVFRNGSTMSGTLTSADAYSITFTDRNGVAHRFSVHDVSALQFSDTQASRGGPAAYAPPDSDHPDDQGNGNSGNYANQDNSAYDQARMEHVVLPAGTVLPLRTNEHIDSHDVVEGQTFSAEVAEDIRNDDGLIAIPRGSGARLITRRLENNGDITLDVESVYVAGRRYRVSTEIRNWRANARASGPINIRSIRGRRRRTRCADRRDCRRWKARRSAPSPRGRRSRHGNHHTG